ncbi:MAG: hypothetical protein IJI12_00730 [Atopobiaceae bacterium]|nr:hypothetical protein [Atopobiaceae bacterium]
MYHEVTYEQLRHRRKRRLTTFVVMVLICAVLCLGLRFAQDLAREQGAAALRTSIIDAAAQCCAVEGSYPTTVRHLEEHYGLVINKRSYDVRYEWLGDNIAPSVVVRPL